MTTRFIFICLIVVIFSSCCSKWQQANSYETDTIHTYFDTLVGERIFPIELTDSTYQLAKIQQIYCCLELEKDVLCVVANITCLNIDSTFTDVGYHERSTILPQGPVWVPGHVYQLTTVCCQGHGEHGPGAWHPVGSRGPRKWEQQCFY